MLSPMLSPMLSLMLSRALGEREAEEILIMDGRHRARELRSSSDEEGGSALLFACMRLGERRGCAGRERTRAQGRLGESL